MDVALGFDTSCYTTSVAAVDSCGQVVAFQRMLLPLQSGQCGLRQSEAVFAHVRQMPLVAEQARASLSGLCLRAVAASDAPCSETGSYMPVFTVGAGCARTLAAIENLPCFLFSHQQGHIAAGQLYGEPMDGRFVALHLSGGTTDLLLSQNGTLRQLGGSLDLHAGQLIDRVGVAMGLPFPAGPSLEQLALSCPQPAEHSLPVSLEREDLACHLSGAETRCQQWITENALPTAQIALEVFDFLARTVARMIVAACRETDTVQALVVGGVASSGLLRDLLAERLLRQNCEIDLRFGRPEYSGDNAAGIAWLGMRRWLENQQ